MRLEASRLPATSLPRRPASTARRDEYMVGNVRTTVTIPAAATAPRPDVADVADQIWPALRSWMVRVGLGEEGLGQAVARRARSGA